MRIAELKDKLLSSKIVRFVLVGGCSTGIDFVIYVLLSMQIPITISISMISASVFSYFVNKQYTFANKEKTTLAYLIKFYLTFGANFMVNLGTNYFVYSKTGLKLLAFVMATICGMTVNYIGQRFFVFNDKEKAEKE